MIEKITPTNFVATVFGELTPLNNSALSKARLKIFYKGLNRNGSYITDEVAESLIATLPGTPIVGYYDGDKDDFLGHEDKEKSRCYGFVPQEMNFAWEMSLDPDGVYRTYACTDIILWTGRYPVASKIVGKSHSMELNPDTVEGEWVENDNDFYFRFTRAEFIGLCVLGNEYEPCFEGSSFYELHIKDTNRDSELEKDLKELFSLYRALDDAGKNPTGGQEMEEENKDLTPNVEEEVVISEEVEETDVENTEVEPASEEEQVEAEEAEEATEEVVEDSENQPQVETDAELVVEDDNVEEEEEKEEKIEEEEEIEEENDDSEVLTEEEEEESEESEEEDEFALLIKAKDVEIAQLRAELEDLKSYKIQKIDEEKTAMLNTYAEKLSEEELDEFKNKLGSYETALDLKKDIALCLLDKENAEATADYSLVIQHKEEYFGADAIVANYIKSKNK